MYWHCTGTCRVYVLDVTRSRCPSMPPAPISLLLLLHSALSPFLLVVLFCCCRWVELSGVGATVSGVRLSQRPRLRGTRRTRRERERERNKFSRFIQIELEYTQIRCAVWAHSPLTVVGCVCLNPIGFCSWPRQNQHTRARA